MIYKLKLIIKLLFFLFWDQARSFKNDKFLSFTAKNFGKGHNKKLLITDKKNKKWVVKLCRNSQGKIPDICERERLTFLFARLFGLPAINTRVYPSRDFPNLIPAGSDYIENKVVIMPYIEGKNLEETIKDGGAARKSLFKAPENIANIFAFYHWIGDEDRGTEDFLVRERDKKVYLIDHGLSGPSKFNKILRGAHPSSQEYGEDNIIKKCHKNKESFFDYIFLDLGIKPRDLEKPPVIRLIKNTPNFIIKFYVENSGISDNEYFIEELITRKNNIENDYKEWLKKSESII